MTCTAMTSAPKLSPLALAALLAATPALVAAPAAALAQSADGVYPGQLVCDGAAGAPMSKIAVVVEILGGRASYSFRTGAGTETGGGTVTGRDLVLTGRASGPKGYEARYSGSVTGQGALLVGTQTGKSGRRACQLSLGNGRG